MKRFEDFGIYGVTHGGGNQKVFCPTQICKERKNKRDKSLSVNRSLGIWNCHHCGWTGGLFERTEPFKKVEIKAKPIKQDSGPMEWLLNRGITWEVVQRNQISEDLAFGKKWICFPYFVGSDIVNAKYRTREKDFRQEANAEQVFYKLNDAQGCDEIIICEGEIDALSFEVAGLKNALSVPAGAIPANAQTPSLKYLDNCLSYFNKVKTFILACDDDAPGRRLTEEFARRLGRERCKIVKWPEGLKDANDVLVKIGPTALTKIIEDAKPFPIDEAVEINDIYDDILDIIENGFPKGANLGFGDFDEHLQFSQSGITIVTGIPSHGKSTLLNTIMARLMSKSGWKFGVYSPEFKRDANHAIYLASVLAGVNAVNMHKDDVVARSEVKAALTYMQEMISYISITPGESASIDKLLTVARYLVVSKGVNAFVIDPWNKIDHEYDVPETKYVADTLNKIHACSSELNAHFFIVAHPTKIPLEVGQKTRRVPTLYDVAGSAHFYNMTDNGITVYRNFADENQNDSTVVHIQKVKFDYLGKLGDVKLLYAGREYGGRFLPESWNGEMRGSSWVPQEYRQGIPSSNYDTRNHTKPYTPQDAFVDTNRQPAQADAPEPKQTAFAGKNGAHPFDDPNSKYYDPTLPPQEKTDLPF